MKGTGIQRMLPPAGAPIFFQDFVQGLKTMLFPADNLPELKRSIREFFSVEHVFLLSSGKAALTIILQALASIDKRREVIIPSYTCFSVPASIVRAGLKNVICDVEPFGVNYDTEQLRKVLGSNTLCVIAPHLFGIPSDVETLTALTRPYKAFFIEDCAQAMGAELNGKKTGTIGDVAFFSFGRGKNICAGSGGIIVTNNELIAQSLLKTMADLPFPHAGRKIEDFATALFLSIFSHPYLYWLPANLPFLRLGETIYSTEFRVEHMPSFHAGLAKNWREKLSLFNSFRRARAETYARELMPYGFRFLKEPKNSKPVYPRFPVLTRNRAQRDCLYQRLFTAGLGASLQYPSGIGHIPQLPLVNGEKRNFSNGDLLATLLITLPTHPGVSYSDARAIVRTFQENTRNLAYPTHGERVSNI